MDQAEPAGTEPRGPFDRLASGSQHVPRARRSELAGQDRG